MWQIMRTLVGKKKHSKSSCVCFDLLPNQAGAAERAIEMHVKKGRISDALKVCSFFLRLEHLVVPRLTWQGSNLENTSGLLAFT